MRRLIINADDLGANPSRDHGILETFERGAVTSATLMANGSNSLRAAELARRAEMPTGLHLNFSDGFPLSPQKNVASLLSAEGLFLEKKRLRRALDMGEVQPEHIEWEFRAQMKWINDHRGQPTHLDSHHNVHVHPSVAQVLAPLLSGYGIRFVRITDEPPAADFIDQTDEQRAHFQVLADQARAARALYEAYGIGSTDHFRGFGLSGNASKRAFRQLLRSLPEGTTELMVHPGQCAPQGDDFSRDPQRETEREMLIDEEIPALLAQQKIELISYEDL